MFHDREDASTQLVETLREHDVDADTVIAIPPDGLPVGRYVADAFDISLDVIAARPIEAPFNPGLAIGAATSEAHWLDDDLIDRLEIGNVYLEDGIRAEQERARDQQEHYQKPQDLTGQAVIVVDDGIGITAVVRAVITHLREHNASRITVAAPVIPLETRNALEQVADQVVTVETPDTFIDTSQHYAERPALTDADAAGYLPAAGET